MTIIHSADCALLRSQKDLGKQAQIAPPLQKTLVLKFCSLWEMLYHQEATITDQINYTQKAS